MAKPVVDVILDAVRLRFLSYNTSDDLWTRLTGGGLENSFSRRNTEFVRINKDTLVVHVETHTGDLRSFMVKITELKDDPEPPQQRLEV